MAAVILVQPRLKPFLTRSLRSVLIGSLKLGKSKSCVAEETYERLEPATQPSTHYCCREALRGILFAFFAPQILNSFDAYTAVTVQLFANWRSSIATIF